MPHETEVAERLFGYVFGSKSARTPAASHALLRDIASLDAADIRRGRESAPTEAFATSGINEIEIP